MRTDVKFSPSNVYLLRDPAVNKGTAFTEEERDALGLRGLLPPRVLSQTQQMLRVLANFRNKPSDLERYIFLMALLDRNERLFYRLALSHLEEMMPIISIPTVGLACQEYGQIFPRARGMFITARDAGRVAQILRNWPSEDVRLIVVTNGEHILDLGDLGANGMGIPIGKLSLYTACAGVQPSVCLPVTIDVGTDNEQLLEDPLYIGLQHRQIRGTRWDDLLDEFVTAVQKVFPQALIHFEDFASPDAFRLLKKYGGRVCMFFDNVQGVAALTLAGLYSAVRITVHPMIEQRFLFCGAGQTGIGIADLVVMALIEEGLSEPEARARCWFVDSKGLVVKRRTDLAPYKLPYAHDHEFLSDLVSAIDALQPTALIGVSGKRGAFTQPILKRMAQLNERPIIFALSNPTSKSECKAEDAYRFTHGAA